LAKASTPSFITEIPLVVETTTAKELRARFSASRQLYNACLNEGMVRMELMRQSEAYQQAKTLKKGKSRTQAFKKVRELYGYSEYDLHAFSTLVRKESKWIADKIDSNTTQKLATRAFKASERVLFGQAKKVRFKVPSRFRSVEGKTNTKWHSLERQPANLGGFKN